MKICIGSRIVEGPFGGGNEFLKNLHIYLELQGHIVVNELKSRDIDVILLTNPLPDSETSTFNNFDIDYYINFINPNAIVFQRINECDERKNTTHLNKALSKYNQNVDINIFVSQWLKNNFKEYDLIKKPSFVVLGGPTKKIFNINGKKLWNGKEKIKIVTHHWSDNMMKGYDFYKEVDSILDDKKNKDLFEFTIIGNTPKTIQFNNSTLIPPLTGIELANELKKNHIYLTASVNEPSGNHHMEGAMCGLPILYINSGAIPEYCNNFGIETTKESFLNSLEKIKKEYTQFIDNLQNYSYTFENASEEFLNIFKNSMVQVNEIRKLRNQNYKFLVLFKYINNKIYLFIYSKFRTFKKVMGRLKNKLF